MKRIKDILLESLSEDKDFLHLDKDVIGDIKDVTFSKKHNYLKIDFVTTYGKHLNLLVKHTDFLNWIKKNSKKYNNLFLDFLKDFISSSSETPELQEVIDDNGDIMADDDKPNNATNTMVGSSNWDLEKVYRSSIPKSIRYMSSSMGLGFVTW